MNTSPRLGPGPGPNHHQAPREYNGSSIRRGFRYRDVASACQVTVMLRAIHGCVVSSEKETTDCRAAVPALISPDMKKRSLACDVVRFAQPVWLIQPEEPFQ